MTNQPRNSNGNFVETETVESEQEVTFYITEFECRVIGNRLERAAQRYQNLLDDLETSFNIDQDCRFWSDRFDSACSTREKCDEEYYENGEKRHLDADNYVQVKMTSYECWSIGNRLFEIGEWFEEKNYDRIAAETKWLARRFHAEEKEVRE
jgi:hypothetical protein